MCQEKFKLDQYQNRQTGTDTVLTVEKIILFIPYVINCTEQVKHKREKIKIIVKGPERLFGIKGCILGAHK